jgi:serine/threonine-protein kinase
VYAAGVVLYEMLCCERPFTTRGPAIEVLTAHLQQLPAPPSEVRKDFDIPRPLEAACLRALSKAREERYSSAAEM